MYVHTIRLLGREEDIHCRSCATILRTGVRERKRDRLGTCMQVRGR